MSERVSFWSSLERAIIQAGVASIQDAREARCVSLQNLLAVVFCLVALGYLPLMLAYLPHTTLLIWLNSAYGGAMVLVIGLNHLRLYLAARLQFYLTSCLFITVSTLLLGTSSNVHVFLAAGLFFQFFTFPDRERHIMLPVTAVNFIVFVGLEAWFATSPYVLQIPGDFDYFFRLGVMVGVALFVFAQSYYTFRIIHLAEDHLDAERGKSERLLASVLPESIAQQLKDRPGLSIAERFDEATILFADIVGFTELSEKMSAHELVDMLDRIFREFDALADRHGVEKIKTIGDAYMAAAGVPGPRTDHTQAMADLALAMQAAMHDPARLGQLNLRLRIGIHRGPVVAGVIGERKFLYDLWGDSVNTASRMESHGVEGSIHVTGEVARALGAAYLLEERGEIQVKGKGLMKTLILKRRAGNVHVGN